jgi:retron-type reverse transcriptase
VAATLAVLMTEAERQPVEVEGVTYHVPVGSRFCVQGAPTSPGLCNAIVLRMDRRLAGLAEKVGYTYTRYADDLTFSGDDLSALPGLRRWAARIIEEEGFRINPEKTCLMRKGSRQTVTGVVVNDCPGLSRKERRKLRAIAHRLRSQKERGEVDPGDWRRLEGRLAYLKMLNPEQAKKLSG